MKAGFHMNPATKRLLTPRRLLMASAVVAVFTIALKTLAWYITDSVGLLSDAMESLVNLASAVFGLVMVTIAARPADEDHPYGHHKAEYFSSGFEGILIIVAALGICWAAVQPPDRPSADHAGGLGPGLVGGQLGAQWLAGLGDVPGGQGAPLDRAGSRRQAPGHRRLDVGRRGGGHRAGVISPAGCGWTRWWPLAWRINILREGFHLMWRSSQGLMDEAVEPEVMDTIQATLAGFEHKRGETEIVRFDHIATRKAGQRRFLDMHMHMPASWTLGRAAAVRGSVEQALMSAVPGLRATIQLLPSDVEAHFDETRDLI